MPPDKGKGRPPAGTAPSQKTTATQSEASVSDTTDVAAQLRRVLATDRPDWERGWRDGYQVGFDAGWNVGYGRAKVEHDETWARLAKKVISSSGLPFDELRRLREMPTGAAWEQWRERHGAEYAGGPVDWETGRPVAVEARHG